jgi:RimJ/RimL family protein N-acetyltransferase
VTTLRTSLPCRKENTVLRHLCADDLRVFHAYRSDEVLGRFQGWSAMTAQEALRFIEEMAAADHLVSGDWVQLAIADASSDVMLGDVGLYVDPLQQEAEVGFTLSRAAQGVGHATRAVEAAVDLLFAVSAVHSVRAVTDARNAASIAVLGRAGFRRVFEQQAQFKGETCTEIVFLRMRVDA